MTSSAFFVSSCYGLRNLLASFEIHVKCNNSPSPLYSYLFALIYSNSMCLEFCLSHHSTCATPAASLVSFRWKPLQVHFSSTTIKLCVCVYVCGLALPRGLYAATMLIDGVVHWVPASQPSSNLQNIKFIIVSSESWLL